MAIHTHKASVGVFLRMLANLETLLDKGSEYATERKFDTAVLVSARLAPDMWSLGEQVRAACSFAIRGVCRLTGQDIPSFDGSDQSMADLKARIAWASAFIRSNNENAFEGAEERTVVFPAGDRKITLRGDEYLLTFALPNFFFHVTTVYDILRHNGVPLVKDDYMGKPGT